MLLFCIFVLADAANSMTLPVLAEQLRIRPLKVQDLHFEDLTGQLRRWFGQTPQALRQPQLAEPFRSCAAPLSIAYELRSSALFFEVGGQSYLLLMRKIIYSFFRISLELFP